VLNESAPGLIIKVASSEILVGTTIRVLGVMFDSKLYWGSHITHNSNIVKKEDAGPQKDFD
jgi:hypothetical protein